MFLEAETSDKIQILQTLTYTIMVFSSPYNKTRYSMQSLRSNFKR